MWDRKNWWDKENWKNYHKEFHERLEQFAELGVLRTWILYVLTHGPKNGVEIMDAIEKMHNAFHEKDIKNHQHNPFEPKRFERTESTFKGHHHEHGKHASWRPSPGSIYPMLSKMVEEDLINKMEDGRYELTLTGQKTINKLFKHFPAPYEDADQDTFKVEGVLTKISTYISYLEDIGEDKLISHQSQIDILIERLKKIEESLKKE